MKKVSIKINKKKKSEPPLYHAIQVGAGCNPHTGKHSPMNLYISDEMLKVSERDRMRRMAKIKKNTDDSIIIIKPENDSK